MLSADQEHRLVVAAEEGLRNAYSKHGKPDDHRIGAAVLTVRGNVYSSGHYYSPTASLTIHSEQAALVHAAAHGEYAIVAVAVTGNGKGAKDGAPGPIYPCHMCKQILWESHVRSGVAMEILCVEDGRVRERIALEKMVGDYVWPKVFVKSHVA